MARPELPSELLEALDDLLGWLKRARIPHAVIGGIAVGLVGQPRTTGDIDAVVFMGDRSWEAFLEEAEAAGFERRIPDAAEFARSSRVFVLRHAKTGIGVDLSAGSLPFEEELVARVTSISVRSIEIPVASPEDLVVMKILASRPRDIADIEGLLVVHPSLDVDRIRRHVRLFGEALEAPELSARLEGLLRSRRKGGPA